jgi:hypothetical protein
MGSGQVPLQSAIAPQIVYCCDHSTWYRLHSHFIAGSCFFYQARRNSYRVEGLLHAKTSRRSEPVLEGKRMPFNLNSISLCARNDYFILSGSARTQ